MMSSNFRLMLRPLGVIGNTFVRTKTRDFLPVTFNRAIINIDRNLHETPSRRTEEGSTESERKMREKLDSEERILNSILTSALELVPKYGWSLREAVSIDHIWSLILI